MRFAEAEPQGKRTLGPKDIVITGLARSTSLGNTNETWSRELAGQTEITIVTGSDLGLQNRNFRDIAAPVGFKPAEYSVLSERSVFREHLNEFGQMVMALSDEAARNARLIDDDGRLVREVNPRKAALAVGFGAGSSMYMRGAHGELMRRGRLKPSEVKGQFLEQAGSRVEERMGLQGYSLSTAEACATGVSITADAYYSLLDGRNEVVIAGAYEYLAEDPELAFGDFHSMRALSGNTEEPEHASRPFDKNRDGFILSLAEGGSIVLETYEHAMRRGAEPIAVLSSARKGSDAGESTTMDTERVADLISETAGNKEPTVIFAHATSTPAGDVAELSAVLKSRLGKNRENLRITAGKSMRGHSLGAAGMQTLISSIEAIRTGVVPPTINLETLDPAIEDMGLTKDNFVTEAARLNPQDVFVGAFGFGGKNAVAVVSRP
jgi:3-oxoacyl-[acyl-carrier-protein] synthase II